MTLQGNSIELHADRVISSSATSQKIERTSLIKIRKLNIMADSAHQFLGLPISQGFNNKELIALNQFIANKDTTLTYKK